MLTDTTFWIDLARERQGQAGQARPAHRFIATHRAHSLEISLVTWAELAVGFEVSAPLDHLLRYIRVLGLPRQIGWEASRIERELRQQGQPLGENDTWIAATARTWGLPLVTNDDAFDRVRRLRVIRYA